MLQSLVFCLMLQAGAQGAAEHQKAGVVALKEGRTDSAIAEFRKVVELAPKQASGYLDLGVAYMKNHDYGSAIDPLKTALQLDSDLTQAHQFLGYALLARGYAAEAVAQFEKVKDPAGLGIAQLEAGDLPDAVQNLHTALLGRPDDPDLEYYLARASGLLSKQMYDRLVSSHTGSPRVDQALAENYAALRRVQEAETNYQAALRQRPDLPGAHLALGELYAAADRWDEAEQQFRAEAKLEPGNPEAAYRLGSALLQNGKLHEARIELQRADSLLPNMAETLYALGRAESLEGDNTAAEREWNHVIALEQGGQLASKAHFGLAAIYRKQGRTADAGREMKQFEETRNSPN